jgi:diguanylate cyclase (GGDEF)-like protein
MRLLRVGALFGSLVLLVATFASLLNQRSTLYQEQDTRVSSAATTATNSVQTTLERARAVVEVATDATTPEALLRTFDDSAQACIGQTCSGPDLAARGAFGAAAAAVPPGGSVAVVDVPSTSVLVVARTGDSTADDIVSIQLPLEAIVGPLARSAIEAFGTDFDVTTSGADQLTDVSGIRTVDGRRVVLGQISEPLDSGSILVRSSVPNNVGWGAESPGKYLLFFGFGTILLALAGWTFLAENRQLERRATTDELTGLVNRREFERVSEEAIDMAGRFGTGLCVMLIDLNSFKEINDTLGHQFGDLVLKGCAERLVDAIRDTDVVGRWGGDEFVVLLPGLQEASGVRNSAERIGDRLSSTPVTGDVLISGSIGAALFPRHGSTLDELIQAADIAMYEAKTTGVVHRLAVAAPVDKQLPSPTFEGPDRRKSTVRSDETLSS